MTSRLRTLYTDSYPNLRSCPCLSYTNSSIQRGQRDDDVRHCGCRGRLLLLLVAVVAAGRAVGAEVGRPNRPVPPLLRWDGVAGFPFCMLCAYV